MHFLSTKQIVNREQLTDLFRETDLLKSYKLGQEQNRLSGKVLAIVKDEGSTRTRMSFEVAMKRMGGNVTLLDLDKTTSLSKGETLEDTIRTVSQYVDIIAMRHSQKDMVQHCSNFSSVPVINAGDGHGEHPTQALLDAYTIRNECGRLSGLNIMIAGDLKCSRTAHSLLHLLSLYPDNLIHLVSPKDMMLPDEYKSSNINYIYHPELDSAIAHAGQHLDVLYMTRLQRERYLSEEEVMKYLNERKTPFLGDWESLHKKSGSSSYYILNSEVAEKLNKTCCVLHPLPRNEEIPVEFDKDPRAAYFKQVKNGMWIRMALLWKMLTNNDFFQKLP